MAMARSYSRSASSGLPCSARATPLFMKVPARSLRSSVRPSPSTSRNKMPIAWLQERVALVDQRLGEIVTRLDSIVLFHQTQKQGNGLVVRADRLVGPT